MKREKAFFLLEEMNGISDVFLTAAANYPSKRVRRMRVLKGFSVAAAVILLCISVLYTRPKGSQQPQYSSVAEILTSAQGEQVESVDVFSSNKLVWRTTDGKLYQKSISRSQLKRLTSLMNSDERVGEDADVGIDGVWIVSEYGVVRSPYLQQNHGNFAYGDIFDYSPEVIPSSSFTKALEEIIY